MAAGTRLEGSTAIITGSSSGIGRSIALAFAAEGTRLVVCVDVNRGHLSASTQSSLAEGTDASNHTVADHQYETHELICLRHGKDKAIYICCDVSIERRSSEGETESNAPLGAADMVERAIKQAGRIDILINCAGVGLFGIATHETTLEIWEKNMAVNSTGPFLVMKHALTQFLKQDQDSNGFRGTIVNISSIGYKVALRECGAYCASKAAIVGLSRTVAVDYAAKGIRCNVISPGYISTPMLQPCLDDIPGFKNYLHASIPAQRIGQPSDVAPVAVWLASGKESAYVNGSVIPVDGAFTAV